MSTQSFPIPKNLKIQSPHPPSFLSNPSQLLSISFNSPFFPYSFRQKPLKITFFHALPLPQSNPSPPHPSLIQEAISDYLLELGLSKEDALSISLNAPKYAQMLSDSVRDLEEWESWSGNGGGSVGFKEKAIRMAKEKGDNGKVAFLESIGLSLSNAIGVARYLSAESVSALIYKVKYMKEIFFSGSNAEGLVGKNARRMMKHLSIPIDEDVQQTLAFFEKIEARRGGLDMLGCVDVAFGYLVESFPRLLLLPVDSHLNLVVEFLENIGVPRGKMGNVFLLFPPILFADIKDIRTKVLALEKVPKLAVDHGIRSWPHLLGCSTNKLKLMVEQFGELGVQNKNLGKVVAKSPQLLIRKPEEFLQVVLFLEDLGFEREKLGKILTRCPELFAASIDKTLKKKIEFLTVIGISKNHYPRIINKYPEFLVSDVERTLLPRINYLMEVGLSKRDIAFMVRRFSPLLGYSIEEVFKPKIEFLLNTMEKSLRDVVDYPRYFSYSLEKKIKPRYWVLKGRNVECSLQEMLGKNDEEFATYLMGVGSMVVPPSHQ
ncbi:transcription termination factor MTERF2, chloroplastic isoform X2 [Mangifera indica]|uniref:transcription termination factor MTERF2, chloroplastic isoform X2 n=1 Tax=Mangifera indica TaxID=29780 RepID=UPI001CFA8EF1|nr:transcription termination factor MTERF2, chloroplastic isoform X2 [Mangifera indica]